MLPFYGPERLSGASYGGIPQGVRQGGYLRWYTSGCTVGRHIHRVVYTRYSREAYTQGGVYPGTVGRHAGWCIPGYGGREACWVVYTRVLGRHVAQRGFSCPRAPESPSRVVPRRLFSRFTVGQFSVLWSLFPFHCWPVIPSFGHSLGEMRESCREEDPPTMVGYPPSSLYASLPP